MFIRFYITFYQNGRFITTDSEHHICLSFAQGRHQLAMPLGTGRMQRCREVLRLGFFCRKYLAKYRVAYSSMFNIECGHTNYVINIDYLWLSIVTILQLDVSGICILYILVLSANVSKVPSKSEHPGLCALHQGTSKGSVGWAPQHRFVGSIDGLTD